MKTYHQIGGFWQWFRRALLPALVALALMPAGCDKLTGSPDPEQGQTAKPAVESSTIAKTKDPQEHVAFTLTNKRAYPDGTTWTVYTGSTGDTEADGVWAESSDTTLTLSGAADVKPGTYYVSAAEKGKTESPRLRLMVTPFVGLGQTAAPEVFAAALTKTAAVQAAAAFTLTNDPAYPADTVWKVYAAGSGTAEAADILVAVTGAILTLSHAADIPSGNYWVSARKNGWTESKRLKLTVSSYVTPDQTAAPEIPGESVAKTAAIQAKAVFTLTNDPAYPNDTAWKVYVTGAGDTEAAGISASNSGATLTLSGAVDIPETDYYVSAKETGKTESNRVRLWVTGMEQTVSPAVSVTGAAKITDIQESVEFALTNSTEYAAGAVWKVYTTADGITPAVKVTASNTGATLTLRQHPYIVPKDYWVTATVSGKTESARLKLTVAPKAGTGKDSAIKLDLRTWVDNFTTFDEAETEHWYKIETIAGKSYYVQWNDTGEGDGTKTDDVQVSIYTGDGTSLVSGKRYNTATPDFDFDHIDAGFTVPVHFLGPGGTVYLKVTPAASGTYAIRYFQLGPPLWVSLVASSGDLTLTWKDWPEQHSDITGYRIYRVQGNSAERPVNWTGTIGYELTEQPGTSYLDRWLGEGYYWYKIFAYNADEESEVSEIKGERPNP
jgi:hypothetical protein